MSNRIVLLLITVFFIGVSHGMAGIRKANRCFELYEYSRAIPLYLKVVKKGNQVDRMEATARLADCYRLVNNAYEAKTWYTKAIELNNPDPLHYFYLGQALRTLGQYEEAEKAFLQYARLVSGDNPGKMYAGYCHDIKKLGLLPETVEIKNASSLNSKLCDFGPVFYKNGMILISDRSTSQGGENDFGWTNSGYLDLYFSEPLDAGDFFSHMSIPVKMSRMFNQKYHDGPVAFSNDFKTVFLTRTLIDKRNKSDGLRTSMLKIFYASVPDNKKIKWQPFPYNSDDYSVGHPALSKDGRKLVFSSDMPGGHGGSDLYFSEIENDKWSVPVNLGSEINSSGKEVFPFWYNDSTLYFSSDGWMGYGGLDLYESKLVDGKWTVPENMLSPVNSSYDDFGLVFRQGSGNGFFSSNRPGGLGADDIYSIRNYSRLPVQKKQTFIVNTGGKTSTEIKSPVPEVSPAPETGIPETLGTEAGKKELPPGTVEKEEVEELIGENAAYYSVQVMASLVPIDPVSNALLSEEYVFEKKIGSFYKYFIGRFSNFNKAEDERKRLKARFPGCFIVGFIGGKVIPVYELKKILD